MVSIRTVALMEPCGMPRSCCGADEDVVPEAGFEVRLHLGQVEVGAGAAGEELFGVVEEVEAEVEEAAGHGFAVDEDVALFEVPAAGADEEDGGLVVELVVLAGLGSAKVMVRRTASRRLSWPSSRLSQVGVVESSKSAMKTLAPELRALMIILRSTGPVISTRRSRRSAGSGATVQSASRMSAVSGRKSGRSPASRRAWRATRAARSSLAAGVELAVQGGEEGEGFGGEDGGVAVVRAWRGIRWRLRGCKAHGVILSGCGSVAACEGGSIRMLYGTDGMC